MNPRTLKKELDWTGLAALVLALAVALTGCKVKTADTDTPVFKAVCGGPAITIDLSDNEYFFPESGTVTTVEFKGASEGAKLSVVEASMTITFTPPPAPFEGAITLNVSSAYGETEGKSNSAHGTVRVDVSCGDGPGPGGPCTCEVDVDCMPTEVCRKCKCVVPTCGDGVVDPGEECESQTDCDSGAICTGCKCVTATCGNGTIEEGEECEASNDCGDGMTCYGCKCEESACGDGVVEGDEECELPASCDPGEICSDCVCAAGSLWQDCNPGAMPWDAEYNNSAVVVVDPYTCACSVSSTGYLHIGFQYLPDQGVITAVANSSMSISQTEPDIGWGTIEEVPIGAPVTYWLSTLMIENPDLALATVKITATADAEGLSDVSIECSN